VLESSASDLAAAETTTRKQQSVPVQKEAGTHHFKAKEKRKRYTLRKIEQEYEDINNVTRLYENSENTLIRGTSIQLSNENISLSHSMEYITRNSIDYNKQFTSPVKQSTKSLDKSLSMEK